MQHHTFMFKRMLSVSSANFVLYLTSCSCPHESENLPQPFVAFHRIPFPIHFQFQLDCSVKLLTKARKKTPKIILNNAPCIFICIWISIKQLWLLWLSEHKMFFCWRFFQTLVPFTCGPRLSTYLKHGHVTWIRMGILEFIGLLASAYAWGICRRQPALAPWGFHSSASRSC